MGSDGAGMGRCQHALGALVCTFGDASVTQEVVQCAAVVSEHLAFTGAVSVSFDRDDAAGHEGASGLVDGITPGFHGQIGVPKAQHVQ